MKGDEEREGGGGGGEGGIVGGEGGGKELEEGVGQKRKLERRVERRH